MTLWRATVRALTQFGSPQLCTGDPLPPCAIHRDSQLLVSLPSPLILLPQILSQLENDGLQTFSSVAHWSITRCYSAATTTISTSATTIAFDFDVGVICDEYKPSCDIATHLHNIATVGQSTTATLQSHTGGDEFCFSTDCASCINHVTQWRHHCLSYWRRLIFPISHSFSGPVVSK